MKHHILHDSRTSTSFKKSSSYQFKDVQILKLLTSFDTSLTSLLGGLMNLKFNLLFTTPRDEVRFTSKFVRSFNL